MKKIVFYEVFEEEREALEKRIPKGWDVSLIKETVQESGWKKLPAPIISVRTQSIIPAEWVQQGLAGVLTRSTGYDHLMAYRKKVSPGIASRGIVAKGDAVGLALGYLPDYCSSAVAEQAIIMLLSLWRKMPAQMRQLQKFSRDGLTGQEFLGKKVLVVGVGRIGTQCVHIASALGMKVKGVDIDRREKQVDYIGLSAGAKWADAIICALPLTAATNELFGLNFFEKAKQGLVFVNVSRGEISPIKAVHEALKKGYLSGAGLDVYDNESVLAVEIRTKKQGSGQRVVNEMLAKQNVILTPHNAFNTQEALARKAEMTVASLRTFFKKGSFADAVPSE